MCWCIQENDFINKCGKQKKLAADAVLQIGNLGIPQL